MHGELPARRELRYRPVKGDALLGYHVPAVEQAVILRRLDCGVEEADPAHVSEPVTWTVTVPTFRPDLGREVDLIEEVGRIDGYRKLSSLAPIVPIAPRRPRPLRRLERKVAATLSLQLGYAEVKHRSFYGAKDAERVGLSRKEIDGMVQNEDGSVDIYFAPEAPEGLDTNWIPTGGEDFFVMFRLYGPEDSASDKSWQIGNIEKVQ